MLAPSVLLPLLLAVSLPAGSAAHGGPAVVSNGRSAQHRRLAQRVASSLSPLPSPSPATAVDKRAQKTDWVTETVTQTSTRQVTIRAAPAGATDAASSVAVVSGDTTWDYRGCYQDGADKLLAGSYQQSSSNTPSQCIATCLSQGYSYAGVEYGKSCYCANELNTSSGLGAQLDDSKCDFNCDGDKSLKCGASYKLGLYKRRAGTITSGATQWSAQGCFQDGADKLLSGSYQQSSSNTPEQCIATCLKQGYSYAGTEYGKSCYCGSELNTASGLGAQLADTACNYKCTGRSSTMCGASYKMNLYQLTNSAASSSAAPSSTKATATSTVAAGLGTPTATVTSGSMKWGAYGCYQDGAAQLLAGSYQQSSSNSASECIATCSQQGYKFAGTEYRKSCYCGNELNTKTGLGEKLDDAQCNYACTGDSKEMCGASYKLNLYQLLSGSASSSVKSSTTSSLSAAPTPTATIVSGRTTWQEQGCYQDGADKLLAGSYQQSSSNTPTQCIATCLKQGYSFAGVEYGKSCYCGSSLNTGTGLGKKLADSACTYTCTGDKSLNCGASYKMNLYKQISGLSSSSSTASSTSSAPSGVPTAKWTYSHCASDYPYAPQAGRSLTGAGPLTAPAGSKGMTNVLCQSMCETRGFTMAGTQNGDECWCGNYLDNGNGVATDESLCPYGCAGDSSQKCGGGWHTSIYTSSKLKSWSLARSYEGSSFFDGWWWFHDTDPTNGFVDYVDWPEAFSSGLASINSAGRAVMKVETTPVVSDAGRKSVRIATNDLNMNAGSLLIMDAVHMPVQCGAWPAWWTLGTGDWPAAGEIDIFEGVHFFTTDLSSIHTASGCSIPTLFGGTSTLEGVTNCAALETSNTGCGQQDETGSPNYGVPFNNNGGGVYALLWTEAHIEVYFFPRGKIPSDIANKKPTPDHGGWGQPTARWPATNCSPLSKYFYNHNAIFDTTFCGDWAGNAWTTSNVAQGQPQSCAALTGYATCKDYVKNRGGDFGDAYWEINYVRYYKQA